MVSLVLDFKRTLLGNAAPDWYAQVYCIDLAEFTDIPVVFSLMPICLVFNRYNNMLKQGHFGLTP